METILQKIVETKKLELTQAKQNNPLSAWKHAIESGRLSLKKHLLAKPMACIAECKKASPSEGVIRKEYDLSAILQAYNTFASAISVLTDETYFQGKIADLQTVRNLTSLPILRKDFIIDPYQIYEARWYGANAFLLIAAILSDAQLHEYIALGKALGMEALIEVHTEEECKRALEANAEIIGINNRNLHNFTIDISTTHTIAKHIPKDRVIVSESGIQFSKHIHQLLGVASAVLIGTSFMKTSDIKKQAENLFSKKLLKVCGITRLEDALGLTRLPVAWMGCIFYADSPRYISPDAVLNWLDHPNLRAIKKIGVFVNETVPTITSTVKKLNLDGVQLHGTESEAYIQAIRGEFPNLIIIKAYRMLEAGTPKNLPAWSNHADFHLLDAGSSKVLGGTGIPFNWEVLDSIPPYILSRTLLAGGIGPEIFPAALQQPVFGLDLNSRFETQPGVKNISLLAEVLQTHIE